MPDGGATARCLATIAVFAVLVAPLYMMFRLLVGLLRDAYGFTADPSAGLPALRVCSACHNTVMEDEFTCCPYCGAPLPSVAAPEGPCGEQEREHA